jgi:hypothetical protein
VAEKCPTSISSQALAVESSVEELPDWVKMQQPLYIPLFCDSKQSIIEQNLSNLSWVYG